MEHDSGGCRREISTTAAATADEIICAGESLPATATPDEATVAGVTADKASLHLVQTDHLGKGVAGSQELSPR